ncbi:hypothetical protein [Mycolicibacter heraklionensis]|uniref:hypothetical protein n=1 Tax=Mycolicibacter heraklionensis TaxID=512402 RepID=UPI000B20C3CD|nr:hypothetical protein [Mycolicibacter heraklionensis]
MKHIAWGIVVGGAAVAAFAGPGVAAATGGTWAPDYDVNDAQLFAGLPTLGQEAWSPAWELPASFTSSNGTILTGTDYISSAPGGLNDEFVTSSGATYDQEQLFPGFTNLYYNPSADGTAVDVMKTPFGNIDLTPALPSFSPYLALWLVEPFAPDSTATTVGQNIIFTDSGGDRITSALSLTEKGSDWIGGPATDANVTPLVTPESGLVWSVPATFTDRTGTDAVTSLTGTEYVTSPTDVEFVDKAGDVFSQQTLVPGLFVVDNLYYDPTDGPAQDYLQTIFGTFDISPLASWFAPTDVSDLASPSLLPDLSDAGLYSALDLGLLS